MKNPPAWLVALFPCFKERPTTWAQAVKVTDPVRLARLDRIYAEQLAWVHSVKPGAIQQPNRLVTLREWPRRLKSPFGIAKVLAPNVIAGDTGGTLLLHEGVHGADEEWLMAHECRHAITGEGGHPAWLYPSGGLV